MTEVERDNDVTCPFCEALLKVDDPDDLEGKGRMFREERLWMVCPRCDNFFWVHVVWEPTYKSWGT